MAIDSRMSVGGLTGKARIVGNLARSVSWVASSSWRAAPHRAGHDIQIWGARSLTHILGHEARRHRPGSHQRAKRAVIRSRPSTRCAPKMTTRYFCTIMVSHVGARVSLGLNILPGALCLIGRLSLLGAHSLDGGLFISTTRAQGDMNNTAR
jgi:hypothetical protein